MIRTNLEALLPQQPDRPTRQATQQPQPFEKAPKPGKKPRASPKAGPAPKKASGRAAKKGAARPPPEGGDGDGDEGEPDQGNEGDLGGGSVALTSAHERAYARFRSEIAALSLNETRRITVYVPSAAILVLGALPKIMALRPPMVATFVNPPLEALDRLEDRALAAAHAHANLLPEDAGETEVRALLKEATPLRERFLLSAEAVASFGLLDTKRVEAIRRGAGHLDTAQDLWALATLFRGAWALLDGKVPFAMTDIERAADLSNRLLKALGQREQGSDGSGEPGEAEAQLAKAYELMRRDYETCRNAVVFLRVNEGDADEIAPPLGQSRRRARRPQADEPGGETPAPVPAESGDGEADAG